MQQVVLPAGKGTSLEMPSSYEVATLLFNGNKTAQNARWGIEQKLPFLLASLKEEASGYAKVWNKSFISCWLPLKKKHLGMLIANYNLLVSCFQYQGHKPMLQGIYVIVIVIYVIVKFYGWCENLILNLHWFNPYCP